MQVNSLDFAKAFASVSEIGVTSSLISGIFSQGIGNFVELKVHMGRNPLQERALLFVPNKKKIKDDF